jgi:hypothetical protein
MRRSTTIGLGAATIAVLDVAVGVEALRTGRPALGVVALVAALGAVALTVATRRPCIELRPDLADWTARTAAGTGEEETSLVDRAVARHRAALDAEPEPDG